MTLSETLKKRGFLYQTSTDKIAEIFDGQKRTVYLGVDPTADSIHVGNLVAYMLMRRLSDAGHKIILLVGGGTGLIGDPKPDVERPLLNESEISERTRQLQTQAAHLLGDTNVEIVNNADWLTKIGLIEFLRDTGKHFTVNSLVKKDAISARMQSEEGISFTEFSYPLLQAYDFWHLYRQHGCDVQIGGSDQWGNIIAGTDLIRRKEGKIAYAVTIPLITEKSTGKKFGKSEGNAIWLDPKKTSPFDFYQFWFNTEDASVSDFLNLFTFLSDEDIDKIMTDHHVKPHERMAQIRLGFEITSLVHGLDTAELVQKASAVLFSSEITEISDEVKALLIEQAKTTNVTPGQTVIDVLVQCGLAPSKREARQLLSDGAVSLNKKKTGDRPLAENDFINGLAVLRKGKKHSTILVI